MRHDGDYAEFVSARWSALYRLAYLLTGTQVAAEDLLQTALLRTYAAWPKVTAAGSPEAYVRRILTNTAISEHRRNAARPRLAVGPAPEPAVPDSAGALADRAALWPLVCALPPRQRAVVVLRYYEDLTEAEIAGVMDCAPGTVKSQAAAALRSLRAALTTAGEGR